MTDGEDVAALAREIRALRPGAIVAWDTETAAPPETHAAFKKPELALFAGAYVAGISVSVVHGADPDELVGYYVPVGHRDKNAPDGAVGALVASLTDTEAAQVLHHATFDWQGVGNLGKGFRPSRRTVDTQVVRWLQDENAEMGLKVLGEILTGEDAGKEKRELAEVMKAPYRTITEARAALLEAFPELGFYKIKGERVPYDGRPGKKLWPNDEAEAMAQTLRRNRTWTDLLATEISPYAARDATMTYEVGEGLIGHEGIINPNPVLQREMRIQHLCNDMTVRGVSVDVDQLHAADAQYKLAADEIALRLEKEHGVKNVGSNQEIERLLYDKLGLPCLLNTDGGGRSVSKNALEMLEGHPVAADVMEYRRLEHARSAYSGPFATYAEMSPDGRIHGHYSSTRTVTGRLSASGPNVMTIPRHTSLPEIRKAFHKVPPGIERSGFDLASAELWVTASLTGDPVLTAALQEGRSLHVETMKAVFGTDDKSSRFYTLSKNVNYGSLYEAGARALAVFAAKAGFDPDEAMRVAYRARDGHRRLYAKQHAMSDALAELARVHGKLPLHVPGRYRHFRSPGVIVEFYTALNAMVQGGVAEFMKDTMIEVENAGYGELLVLQVHDELVFDHPAGMRDEIHVLLTKIAHDINPFKYVLQWDGHDWSEE